MKNKLFIISMFSAVFLAFAFLPHALYAQDRPLPEHFAGRMTVTGDADSLLVLEIPEEIYRGLERPDMGDIRVFDADGILVPFVIRNSSVEIIIPPPCVVPFFIWNPANNQTTPNNRDIEIDITGAVVRITSTQEAPSVPIYLVDLSSFVASPIALEISFDHNNIFFNSTAEIHTSTDLNRWDLYNKPQTVAYYGDANINRNIIELPSDSRYVLIKFSQTAPQVKTVNAVFAHYFTPARTMETIISGEKSEDGKYVYYDTKGYYPILNISFRFAQPDSILTEIKNQFDYPKGDPVYFLRQNRLYTINNSDGVRQNPPLPIELKNAGRHWTLTALGESLFANIPDCYLTWERLQLVFLARGNGPWTISYGNVLFESFDKHALYLSEDEILLPASILENNYTPLPPVKESRDWSKWILWGVLIFAAGGLTLLAFFAAKSIEKG